MSSTGNSVSTGGGAGSRRPLGLLTLAYSAFAYVCFLAVLIYTAGFIAGLGVPKNISTGPHSPWPLATAIDLALLGLFAVQHSAMARPWFKGWLTRLVPPAAERSTYVLASSVALALLYWLWRAGRRRGLADGRPRPRRAAGLLRGRLGGRGRLDVPDRPW